MDEKFQTLLSVVIIPQTVAIIVEKENLDCVTAINEFYSSKVYDLLSDEKTKTWHFSPMMLYSMWKEEKETGDFVYPEGVV